MTHRPLWSCRSCGSPNLFIPPSWRHRPRRKGGVVLRGRKCRDCGHEFTTAEVVLGDAMTVQTMSLLFPEDPLHVVVKPQ